MSNKTKSIEEIWQGDHLGRRKDAKLLDAFLAGIHAGGRLDDRSFVLNLDAGWGRGKTFFLKCWKEQLEQAEFRVAYIDAWATDYAEDPLLAVVSEIEKTIPVEHDDKKTALGLARVGAKAVTLVSKTALRGAARWAIGDDGIDELADLGKGVQEEGMDGLLKAIDKASDAAGARMVAAFEQGQHTADQFKKLLTKAVVRDGYDKPLIVIIDELDRCRPSYAVAMLERIKHWFDVPNVVFVVATDTEQLRHAITAVYGVGFDGRGYLLRFFDRTYRFAEPDRSDWVRHLFEVHQIADDKLSSPFDNDHAAFFVAVATTFDLSLREIERCFEMMRTAAAIWQHKFKLQLLYALPLIVASVRDDKEWMRQLEDLKVEPDQWAKLVKGRVEIPYTFTARANRTQQTTLHSVHSLLLKFLNLGSKSLPEIVRKNDEGASGWIVETYSEEFRIGHGNRYVGHIAPMSAIREYPELIRSVARFEEEQEAQPVAQ